jgi:hypothetical protein
MYTNLIMLKFKKKIGLLLIFIFGSILIFLVFDFIKNYPKKSLFTNNLINTIHLIGELPIVIILLILVLIQIFSLGHFTSETKMFSNWLIKWHKQQFFYCTLFTYFFLLIVAIFFFISE